MGVAPPAARRAVGVGARRRPRSADPVGAGGHPRAHAAGLRADPGFRRRPAAVDGIHRRPGRGPDADCRVVDTAAPQANRALDAHDSGQNSRRRPGKGWSRRPGQPQTVRAASAQTLGRAMGAVEDPGAARPRRLDPPTARRGTGASGTDVGARRLSLAQRHNLAHDRGCDRRPGLGAVHPRRPSGRYGQPARVLAPTGRGGHRRRLRRHRARRIPGPCRDGAGIPGGDGAGRGDAEVLARPGTLEDRRHRRRRDAPRDGRAAEQGRRRHTDRGMDRRPNVQGARSGGGCGYLNRWENSMGADEQAERAIAEDLRDRVRALLDEHDPASSDQQDFLAARFDAGLAWVHFPRGSGGLELPRSFQSQVEADLAAAGAPPGGGPHNGIGMGMAAPTIAAFGTTEQRRKFLRPLFTGAHFYCQLFSEPGAGSDLAGVATRAVRDGDDWIVNGQKVWTSSAQLAQRAILVARTDPNVPKHQGLTYFVCDMTDPGVEVRPLRQITGEAEFNEVFLTDVRVPDANRLGAEGGGWKVATTTLNNERVAIGTLAGVARETGMIGKVADAWW